MNLLFLLTEKIGTETEQHFVFPRERTVITFGRSPLCEYRLLPSREGNANRKISAIQASLELDGEEWKLFQGSTARSARGEHVPKKPATPFWIGSSEMGADFIRMAIGSAVYIYREDNDFCLLTCTDEEGLERITNTHDRSGDTQPFDLIGDLQKSIKDLEAVVTTGFSTLHVSVDALIQNDRELQENDLELQRNDQLQAQKIDSIPTSIVKYSSALLLLGCSLFGGVQLLDQNQRKDLLYKAFEAIVTAGAGGGGVFLFKDAVDKRRSGANL